MRGESHLLAIVIAAVFTATVATLIFTDLGKALRTKTQDIIAHLLNTGDAAKATTPDSQK